MHALGPVVLLDSLTADQIGDPPAYFNARYLLATAAASPIPATKTLGDLAGSFVERARAEMHWPIEPPEIVRFVDKGLDHRDIPRLRLLCGSLQNGRMLRRYRGAFHATTRGRALLAPGREGELYLALFEGYFTAPDPACADRCPIGTRLQRSVPQMIERLLQSAGENLTVGELAAGTPPDTADRSIAEAQPRSALPDVTLRQRVLEPLEDLGLIETADAAGERSRHDQLRCRIRVTPLFRRFVVAAPSLN